MEFLYSLSNIVIPISLLTYKSLLQFNENYEVQYGKWFLMILAIYFFNLVQCVFYDSYMFTFLDIVVKLGIPFIPMNISLKINQKITNLHLQIWLDQFRCWMITGFDKYYWKFTEYILSRLEVQQSSQLKQSLSMKLNGTGDKQAAKYVFKPAKHFQNTGVNCNILTGQLNSNILSATKKQLENFKKGAQLKNMHNQTFGQIKPTNQKTILQKKQTVIKIQNPLPKFSYKKEQVQKYPPLKISSKLSLRESNHRIQIDEQEQQVKRELQVPISPIHEKHAYQEKNKVVFKAVEKKHKEETKPKQIYNNQIIHKKQSHESEFKRAFTFTDYTSSQISSHPDRFNKPYREDGEQADLLNKLDLSASQYSDMFDEQEDDQDIRTLECKVEVILQIGVGSNTRLEIYNIQLYSNRDLRIVSLYDRQFQKHKLRCMRKLPNGYFNLIFQGGKITQRKCKFRGQYQPFMKYLQEQSKQENILSNQNGH